MPDAIREEAFQGSSYTPAAAAPSESRHFWRGMWEYRAEKLTLPAAVLAVLVLFT
jgi:hypothetical protein